MWKVSGNNLQMAEGDYGLKLPVTIKGATFDTDDKVDLVIKTKINGEEILAKSFSGIVDNTVNLELTAAESELLPVGSYSYRLDWYRGGSFMCNIIEAADFKVVDKV